MNTRILEVGYKGIGRWWCKTIQDTSDCELAGIIDTDEEVRRSAESETGVPVFSSVEEAKTSVAADAAVIASPSFAHADNVGECLKNRLHVLVEKPFTLDLNEARLLVEHAESEGLALLVSQNYRYHAESCTVRNLIRSGKLGEVKFAQIQGFNLADMGGSSYRCRIRNPHLWEMAIHQFDLIRFLFDTDVERVFCALFNPSWSWYKDSAYTHAWLELTNGIKVNYIGTYVTQGPTSTWDNGWRIEGTGGALLWNESPHGPLQYVSGPEVEAETLPVEQLPHANLQGTLDELIQAIPRGFAIECSARDNLKSLAICTACEISAREQRVIKMADVIEDDGQNSLS